MNKNEMEMCEFEIGLRTVSYFFFLQNYCTQNLRMRAAKPLALREKRWHKPEKKKQETADSFVVSGWGQRSCQGNLINQLNPNYLKRFINRT